VKQDSADALIEMQKYLGGVVTNLADEPTQV
jgi:hypothetical protein